MHHSGAIVSVLVRSSMRSFSGRLGKRFPCASGDYQLLAELGLGVTATVYLALCKPLRRKVAVKLLDLEAIEQAGGLVSTRVFKRSDVGLCVIGHFRVSGAVWGVEAPGPGDQRAGRRPGEHPRV